MLRIKPSSFGRVASGPNQGATSVAPDKDLLTFKYGNVALWNDPSVSSGKLVTELNQYEQAHTYSMIMSLEVLALSANSWQLTTLKP